MSASTIGLPPEVRQYLLGVSPPEHPALVKLREITQARSDSNMQISTEQGVLMQWLVRLIGARKTIEIGTFTGYSALAVALALPDDGEVIACDLNADSVAVGRPFWKEAGVEHKIDFREGDAVHTLNDLLEEGADGFDFAFIDADKENYALYFDRCMKLVRVGGIIAVDNVLWGGSVADETDERASTVAIRSLNSAIPVREGVDWVVVPIGDGVTLVRRTR